VVHVPAPVVRPLIAERGNDAAFGRDGVRAGRKYLRDAGGSQARLNAAERRSEPGAAGADDHHVMRMIGQLIGNAGKGRRSGISGRQSRHPLSAHGWPANLKPSHGLSDGILGLTQVGQEHARLALDRLL
jgi:hypothetical protein